jgi:hypothetical protein
MVELLLFQNLLKKKTTIVGFVAAVQSPDDTNSSLFEMHKEAWVGAINLHEEYVKKLRQMFKCAQCRTNEHTLSYCPLMKNWTIKKKQRNDTTSDMDSSPVGGVNSVSVSSLTSFTENPSLTSVTVTQQLILILEDAGDLADDHFGNVEFDLLDEPNSLDVTTISGIVTPYFDFKVPLGSVRSVLSSQLSLDPSTSTTTTFDMIVDI